MKYVFAFLAVLIALLNNAQAADLNAQNYRRAFALVNSGHALEAEAFAIRGRDAVLNKVLHGIYMAQPGNTASFDDMATFVASNPDWPNIKGILAIAEQKLPAGASPPQLLAWFESHPAVSPAGFYRYIDALAQSGQTGTVTNAIRTHWIEGDFSSDELTAYYSRFQNYLTEEDLWGRVDRFLWKGDTANARRAMAFVNEGLRAVAEARMAIASKSGNIDNLLARVPRSMANDPGLIYDRLKWHIRNNDDDAALGLLRHAPESEGRAESWWEQRQILARRLLMKQNYDAAYELASGHGPLEGRAYVDAEFLSGWLALRFLDSLEDARRHFQNILDHASTPMSRARGAYWLGRTYEQHGDKNQAQQLYETAAALNTTYYGQLAMARIYENPVILATPEPAIPAAVRNTFYGRDLIRAIEKLDAIGEHDRAHIYFKAAIDYAQQRADFALLTELAYRLEHPDYAIEAGKAASQKNMLMAAGSFPLLARNVPRPPDPAFTHALIRQESMFNPDAQSPVGAVGLMQLMPATAKAVAKKIGMKYKPAYLSTPDYNLRVGTAFVQEQINGFDGSYILALAGYNAGPRRVRDWMQVIGDPRKGAIDPIDWVEMIPVNETRNYVQRIIESLQVYRARLAGGKAPLEITRDLSR